MARKVYGVLLADGTVRRIGADTAAMVRRAYPDARRIDLLADYTREPERDRVSVTDRLHTGRGLFD